MLCKGRMKGETMQADANMHRESCQARKRVFLELDAKLGAIGIAHVEAEEF
jgi:hypothetical protein